MVELDYLLRVFVAAGLGAAIGLERDIHGRAAGLRTHMLVCAGSAVFTVLSIISAGGTSGVGLPDPGRIAAQVVTGIGFLGAGVIIKEGFAVRGLTTAACLWIAAAIGMACGLQQYVIAAGTTLLGVGCLVLLKTTERRLKHDSYRTITIVTEDSFDVQKLVHLVERPDVKVSQVSFDRDYKSGHTSTRLWLRLRHRGITDKLAHDIIDSLDESGIPLLQVQWGAD